MHQIVHCPQSRFFTQIKNVYEQLLFDIQQGHKYPYKIITSTRTLIFIFLQRFKLSKLQQNTSTQLLNLTKNDDNSFKIIYKRIPNIKINQFWFNNLVNTFNYLLVKQFYILINQRKWNLEIYNQNNPKNQASIISVLLMKSFIKSSINNFQSTKSNTSALKSFSVDNLDEDKLNQLIKKIGQQFISYKNRLQQQNQVNIAGYKTVGYVNSHKKNNANAQYIISKQSIQKYLYTFCLQIGCDLPTEQQLKMILSLLIVHSKSKLKQNFDIIESIQDDQLDNNKKISQQMIQIDFSGKGSKIKMRKNWKQGNNSEQVNKISFYLLIKICMQLYIQSKKMNIGGIIQRIIIGIRKQIEQQDQQIQDDQNQNN